MKLREGLAINALVVPCPGFFCLRSSERSPTSAQNKSRPKAAFRISGDYFLDQAKCRPGGFAAIGHEAHAQEAEDHHGPSSWLRDAPNAEAHKGKVTLSSRSAAVARLEHKVSEEQRSG